MSAMTMPELIVSLNKRIIKDGRRIAEMEAELDQSNKFFDQSEKEREQAEAELAERDEELKHLHSRWDWTEYWFDNLYPSDWQRCQAKYDATKTGARTIADLRARAEEGNDT